MSNKRKIIFILFVFSLILFLYLVLTSRVVSVRQNDEEKLDEQKNLTEQVVDMKELTENHARELNEVLADYQNIFNEIEAYETATSSDAIGTSTDETNFLQEEILERASVLKERIMNLKAPSVEYKDLHFNLVLSMEKIKDYFENNDPEDKNSSKDLLNQAIDSYNQLKNNN